MPRRLALLVLLAPAAACATAPRPHPVDLQPARQALEDARAEGAAQKAPQSFSRAEGELQKAERLAAQKADASLAAVEAEWAARLALSEARCAARAAADAADADDHKRQEARVRRAEEDQHRLQDLLDARARELELTEAELIRTKARLKDRESKAEASSAIAEARVLLGAPGRRPRTTEAAIEKSLHMADEQFQDENYGAALFFAQKARDLLTREAPASTAAPGLERPPAREGYVVGAASANLRESPSTTAKVLRTAARGTPLTALAARGGWIKVTDGTVTGWVLASLLK